MQFLRLIEPNISSEERSMQMADKFPKDEFDAAPTHGGRHRIRRTARHRVLEFLKIAAYSAIVAVLGFVGLKAIDSLNFFDISSVVAVAPVEEQVPLVALRDGAGIEGKAASVSKELIAAGYNVGTVVTYVPASGGKVDTTAVYYVSKVNQAMAMAIAKKLSTDSVNVLASTSVEFTDEITVVLGMDLK
jgi:hypothetical protein